ncbi:glycosyl transferase [Rhizobium rhizosphaerae]|uniref:Glycosyl transferase n=1 Tax=Xaviernesmea rhizosphaerae TaxID=1672749 RepID=A0ABX3PE08_9HYPH|nr:glycosyltransferase [Xaviernesmea rhizosphaerae]OQP86329.1 glycosyl transferase [Xaviernesmea rhizosphaerae]
MSISADPEGLRRSKPAASAHAIITLVTNGDYAMGATALLHSLRQTGTPADLVVLHTGGVEPGALTPLAALGAQLIACDHLPLSDGFNARHARGALHGAAPFTKGRKPLFHSPLDNFCKLRLWQLTEYESVIFLDADTLVLKPIDRFFAYPEFSAAPNVYQSLADFHRLNSGVFVARPSDATFARMLARLDQPDAFWPRTDQTFLQSFFPDWHGLPVTMNMLQYVWFALPDLWDWASIHVLHYQYEKPWETDHPKSAQLKPLIDLWHRVHRGEPIGDLALLPQPGAKADGHQAAAS